MQRPVGPLEVTIRASRKIAADAKSLVLELPRPLRRFAGPGDGGDLAGGQRGADADPEGHGRIGAAAGGAVDWTCPRTAPIGSRSRSTTVPNPSKAVFAAGLQVHRQKIGVAVTTQVHLDEQAAQVRQTLAYTIAHQRQNQLTLEVPRGLAGAKQMEVFVDNGAGRSRRRLAARRWICPTRADGAKPAATVRKLLRLSPGCLGSCEVVIQYSVEVKDLVARTPAF